MFEPAAAIANSEIYTPQERSRSSEDWDFSVKRSCESRRELSRDVAGLRNNQSFAGVDEIDRFKLRVRLRYASKRERISEFSLRDARERIACAHHHFFSNRRIVCAQANPLTCADNIGI